MNLTLDQIKLGMPGISPNGVHLCLKHALLPLRDRNIVT